MKVSFPHQLGDALSDPTEGQEICVKIDGVVEKNADGQLVLDVSDVRVDNYDEDGEYEDEEESSSEEDAPKHGIVIGIIKKK